MELPKEHEQEKKIEKKSKEQRDRETAERRAAKAEQVKINRAERAIKVEQLRKEKALEREANKNKKIIVPVPASVIALPNPDNDKSECVVCYEAPRTHTTVPCGHFIYCESCSRNVAICAFCRTNVTSCIRTYIP